MAEAMLDPVADEKKEEPAAEEQAPATEPVVEEKSAEPVPEAEV